MALNKLIAAKVAAYYTSWVDPQEFAECVEKGTVSIQRHFLMPKVRFGFYAIGKGEKKFPLDELTDLSYAHHMHVVLPFDVINTEILDTLTVIESTREEKCEEADKAGWGSLNGKGIFELEVVADVGEDPSSGETRYGCLPFGSVAELTTRIGKELPKERMQVDLNISSLSRAEVEAVIKGIFEVFKSSSWTTLNEVDEFARMINKYKVPEEISGDKVLTGKGVGGTIIGTVRNVLDWDTKLMAQIKPGEIVVAVRIHTPELWSLCREVGGFITDEGGVTCNTAIFAREMEIPAIVGTGEATHILKDGQKVIVNGSHGAVYF